MRDSAIVASVAARNPAGLAEAYDKYAARVFSFCRSLLGDPAAAADAVHDTFLITAEAVAALEDPRRLRPWLYAVARNQCHRRLGAGVRPVTAAGTDPRGRVSDDDQSQLLDLVSTAIGGLPPADGEIIELNLRHRLHGADLADTLGVPRPDMHVLALRAHGRLRESLGALLVAQAGRKNCEVLNELLGDHDGTTALARDLAGRHVEHCLVCADRQRQLLGPVMRLGFVSMAPVPPGLRNRVLSLASDASPAAADQRAAIVAQAGPFGAYGFPEPAKAGTGRRRRLATVPVGAIAGAAATAVVAVVIAVVVMVLPQSSHQGHSGLPGQLSKPISPAADNGSAGRPSGPAGSKGNAQAPAGAQDPAAATRLQNEARPFGANGANGALAVQGQSLDGVTGPRAGSASTGPGSSTPASPGGQASHPASPGHGTTSPPPTKVATPTPSSGPTTGSTPTTSPAPTSSPAPTDSPTPTDPPSTGETTAPTAGASVGVAVGGLLSIGVQLGG
jgi:RNA polymerase sigma factor (sigma-70 family)